MYLPVYAGPAAPATLDFGPPLWVRVSRPNFCARPRIGPSDPTRRGPLDMHLGPRAAMGAVLLAALLTPLTSIASASAAEPAWQAPHHLPQPVHVVGRSISCPRSTWCMAVDSLGHGQRFDGRRWRTPSAASHHYGYLNDVSCPSTRFCMAVGPYGYVVHRPGGWSEPRSLPVTGGAVSCTSASFCLVVGSRGHSAQWNGRRWGDVRQVAARKSIGDVACGSPTMCV